MRKKFTCRGLFDRFVRETLNTRDFQFESKDDSFIVVCSFPMKISRLMKNLIILIFISLIPFKLIYLTPFLAIHYFRLHISLYVQKGLIFEHFRSLNCNLVFDELRVIRQLMPRNSFLLLRRPKWRFSVFS